MIVMTDFIKKNEKPTDTIGSFVERDEDHNFQSSQRLKLPNGKQYPYFKCVRTYETSIHILLTCLLQ